MSKKKEWRLLANYRVNGEYIDAGTVTSELSDEDIATLSEAGMVELVGNGAKDEVGGDGTPTSSKPKTTTPQTKDAPDGNFTQLEIVEAIGQLRPVEDFTGGGLPKVPALCALLGKPVSAAERDAAWAAAQEASGDSDKTSETTGKAGDSDKTSETTGKAGDSDKTSETTGAAGA